MSPTFNARSGPVLLRSTVLVCFSLLTAAVQAQTLSKIEAIPSAWRLQDYADGAVSIYFTGSPCFSGHLMLPATASEGVKERLWSTVMAGKLARQPVGIYYREENGNCIISNFYLKETS